MGRKLGQHFLKDQSVLGRIVAAAQLEPGECVLEIGPGKGVLTERLLKTGAKVTAIELDETLVPGLHQRFGEQTDFSLVQGDALKVDLSPEVLFGNKERFSVVANLPYYLSSPLLFRLAARRSAISKMYLMVQREVAERMVAEPKDGKAFGSLSVALGNVFSMELLFIVPPGAFFPPPKVDSAVVALKPLPPRLPPDQEKAFFEHVKGLFSARRKVMLSTLRRKYPGLSETALSALEEICEGKRPEKLSAEEHRRVFQIIQG